MNFTKYLSTLFVAFALLVSVGCEKEGPMEQAGETVDEAAQDMGNSVEDACEDATGDNC